jgi:hypothetical protein
MSRQATDRFQLMAGCLSVQGLNQFLQRGPVKNSRELRPIISNKADVIEEKDGLFHVASPCPIVTVLSVGETAA